MATHKACVASLTKQPVWIHKLWMARFCNHSTRTVAAFDRVLELVAAGMPTTHAAKQVGVDFTTLKAYADADADRKARWDGAKHDRKRGAFEAGFAECLKRIAAGEFLDAVRRVVYGDRLTKSGFNKYLKQDPVRAEQWRQASQGRDRKHPSAGISAKYSDLDFEIMLLALECSGAQPTPRHRHALERHRERNAEFAARYNAMLDRRARAAELQRAFAASQKPKPIERPLGQLRGGLMELELYRRAWLAASAIRDVRCIEDIASEIVEAVLTGDIQEAEMSAYARAVYRSDTIIDWNFTRSTDEILISDGQPVTLGNTLTTDDLPME